MGNGSIPTGILSPGGYVHIQLQPLLCNIGDGETRGGRHPVSGSLLPSLHPLPRLLEKGWIKCKEGLNCWPVLCCGPLSVSIQKIPDPLSQRFNSGMVPHQSPVNLDPLIHGPPRRLQIHGSHWFSIILGFGMVPLISEKLCPPLWAPLGGVEGAMRNVWGSSDAPSRSRRGDTQWPCITPCCVLGSGRPLSVIEFGLSQECSPYGTTLPSPVGSWYMSGLTSSIICGVGGNCRTCPPGPCLKGTLRLPHIYCFPLAMLG